MRSATRIVVSAMGVIMGLAGIEHGVGEILQGNIAPEGIVIASWPDSAFFRIVAGEPAMTIIPNLLITGILAVLVSLIVLAWVTLFVHKKRGGAILILWSTILLLVGGGFGPPLLGIILGTAATGINAPMAWWRTRLPGGIRRFFGKLWRWSLGACLITWLMLFPGSAVLAHFSGLDDPGFMSVLSLFAFGFLLLAILTALGYDTQRQVDLRQESLASG